MEICGACGKEITKNFSIGGVLLCWKCSPEVRIEIDRLRASKKAVNVAHIARQIYRQKHTAGNYLLRDIPKELWDIAKHRSIDDGCTLRDLILKSLNAYLKTPQDKG